MYDTNLSTQRRRRGSPIGTRLHTVITDLLDPASAPYVSFRILYRPKGEFFVLFLPPS